MTCPECAGFGIDGAVCPTCGTFRLPGFVPSELGDKITGAFGGAPKGTYLCEGVRVPDEPKPGDAIAAVVESIKRREAGGDEITVPTTATDEQPWHLAREQSVGGKWAVTVRRARDANVEVHVAVLGPIPRLPEFHKESARALAARIVTRLNDEEEYGGGEAGILRYAEAILRRRADRAGSMDDGVLYQAAEVCMNESEIEEGE